MFKQHRVEIITFALALTASVTVLLWMEFQKPGNGIFPASDSTPGVHHKETGALLLSGRNRQDAVLRFLAQLRENNVTPRATNGNEEGRANPDSKIGELSETLNGANLRHITLSNGVLSGLIIRNADLANSDFRESLVLDADFEGSDFNEADLSLADLSRTNFSKANLSQVQFVGTTAHGTLFREADLSGANFFAADFRGADFSGANLHAVTTGESTRLSGAILTGALNVPDEFRARAESEEPDKAAASSATQER